MNETSQRITFTSECGNCGAETQQDWDRERFNEELRRDTLKFLCATCGGTWSPDTAEQERLIRLALL